MGLSGQGQNQKGTTTNDGSTIGNTNQYGGQYGQGQQNLNYLDPGALAAQKAFLTSQQQRTSDATGAANAGAGGFYQGMLNSPGYSDQVKSAISQTANDAGNEKLAEANHNLQMHGASTGNDAGFAGATANLYGSAATDQAARTRENQIAFANEQQRQKELGGAGMERLLGVNQAAQLGMSGQNNQLSQLLSGTSSTNQNQFNNTGTTGTTSHNTGAHNTTTIGGGAGTGGDGSNPLGGILCSLFKIGCPTAPPGAGNACPDGHPPINGKCTDGSAPKPGGSPGSGGGGTGPGTPGGKPKPDGSCDDGSRPVGGVCPDPEPTTCADGSPVPADGVCPDQGNCDPSVECCPGDTAETNGNCGDPTGGGGGCDSSTECCPGDTAETNPLCGDSGGGGGGDCYNVCSDGSCGDGYGCPEDGGGA